MVSGVQSGAVGGGVHPPGEHGQVLFLFWGSSLRGEGIWLTGEGVHHSIGGFLGSLGKSGIVVLLEQSWMCRCSLQQPLHYLRYPCHRLSEVLCRVLLTRNRMWFCVLKDSNFMLSLQ